MWRTFGHDGAVDNLKRSLQAGRVAHSYLISGPRQVGKMTLALDLCRAVNCLDEERPCGACNQCRRIERSLHADVHVVGVGGAPGGRAKASIGIDQVREVQREAALKPFEGASRCLVFDGAERMTVEAANSLLKTLEEPPPQVLIILLAVQADALLTTIVSRCRVLDLLPVPAAAISRRLIDDHGVEESDADEIARLSAGRPGWAIEAAGSPELRDAAAERLQSIEETLQTGIEGRFTYAARMASSFSRDRETGREELALWLGWWRDVLMAQEGLDELVTYVSRRDSMASITGSMSESDVVDAIKAVLETGRLLDRNVNPRLAFESMMLRMPSDPVATPPTGHCGPPKAPSNSNRVQGFSSPPSGCIYHTCHFHIGPVGSPAKSQSPPGQGSVDMHSYRLP